MLIPPKYFLTPRISELLSLIEANKEVIDVIDIPLEVELNIRRRSTLKSSLFSARIEGNNATLGELPKIPPRDKKKIEINNVLRGINYIFDKRFTKITKKDILSFHSIVMKGLDQQNLGKFRSTHEGIFTTASTVIYHAPPPSLIPNLVDKLLKFILSDKEKFTPIKAALVHYSFEKIHPFVDGSGRVGRLLLLAVLKMGGYGFKGILPFEEKIDNAREVYYRMLEESERDLTNYVEFILETIKDASEETKRQVISSKNLSVQDFLLPRRFEILQIIKEHKTINFDSLKRRFGRVNERTLRYDIKKLIDAGLVTKLGSTRGVYYTQRERITPETVSRTK